MPLLWYYCVKKYAVATAPSRQREFLVLKYRRLVRDHQKQSIDHEAFVSLVNVRELLFHAPVVNNLADDGDVLVKRKKFVGGRSVGRST